MRGNRRSLRKKLHTDKSGRGDRIPQRSGGIQCLERSYRPRSERHAGHPGRGWNFDFFKLLDSVTIARSRKHIQTFYDTTDIGPFPERRKPLSYRCPLTDRVSDVLGFNGIFRTAVAA